MSELAERKVKGKLHCPEKCCGAPVMECVCGPDCAHCNCHEIQKLQKKVDKMNERKTFKHYLKEAEEGYMEETFDGDDFYNQYGDMWYNDDFLDEAEYQGRKVRLGKPMRGDVKKFKVYVKDPKTKNVKKVNFGDPNMKIKKSNPARRKSFRARHNCDNPGPRTKARYWSCRKW
tara:strand:- start:2965 stop:3486 length:522 start_codon:yes stop_codon:yes gene_type:complete